MISSVAISVILIYYAYYDIPENKYISRMTDDESIRISIVKHNTKPNYISSRKFLYHDTKYICILIIAMKCLSILKW